MYLKHTVNITPFFFHFSFPHILPVILALILEESSRLEKYNSLYSNWFLFVVFFSPILTPLSVFPCPFMYPWSNNFWIFWGSPAFQPVVPIVRREVRDLRSDFPFRTQSPSLCVLLTSLHFPPSLPTFPSAWITHNLLVLLQILNQFHSYSSHPSRVQSFLDCWHIAENIGILKKIPFFNVIQKLTQNFNYIWKTYWTHLKTPKCHLK